MEETYLDEPPALARVLARGAVGSVRKRAPLSGARLPRRRLVLRAARTRQDRLAAYTAVCGFPATDPLHAEDRPEIRVHTEGLAPHRRGTRFDVVTQARLAGEDAWRSRSTYLCRHRTSEPAPAPETTLQQAGPLPAAASWDLPGDLGRRYAAASGDRNPIHLHPLTAKAFGFPRAIAHGMWTFARCLAQATAEDGGQPGRLTAEAYFTSPVLLPGTVTYARDGEAFALRGGSDGTRLHLNGRVASSASPPSGSADRPSRSS